MTLTNHSHEPEIIIAEPSQKFFPKKIMDVVEKQNFSNILVIHKGYKENFNSVDLFDKVVHKQNYTYG